MKIVRLMHDDSPECPADFDGQWKVYSFSNRHKSYRNPDDFFTVKHDKHGDRVIIPRSPGLRRKLDVGLAFVLSYYEHGLCSWSRAGHGPQCRWDNTPFAGLLVWEHKAKDMGAKTYEDRAKDADAFLEMYTNWCNGSVYGFSVEEEVTLDCGHTERRDLDSCFGFYDAKYMAEEVRAIVQGDDVRFEGAAADLASYYDFKGEKPDLAVPVA